MLHYLDISLTLVLTFLRHLLHLTFRPPEAWASRAAQVEADQYTKGLVLGRGRQHETMTLSDSSFDSSYDNAHDNANFTFTITVR